MAATLYIVATPIGNLEDITLRALRVLREVGLIAAEDTRHSRKLLNHYGINTPLSAYHEHNEERCVPRILEVLRGGRDVALISDAGTPTLSDPGFSLVRACRAEGIAVRAVPGPSALIAALSVAGLPMQRFVFEGFLPAKARARDSALALLAAESRTVAFYEAPHRLRATLEAVSRLLGAEREVAVARELTKVHEELARGSVRELLERFGAGEIRGEIVLLIGPAQLEEEATGQGVRVALRRLASLGTMKPAEMVREVARATGTPRNEVYEQWLRLREEQGG